MEDSRISKILNDKSTHLLIISNIITIIFAVIENWDFLIILFVYWCQSIIIGFFAILKILNLKEFSTENLYINYEQPLPNEKTKKQVAVFLAIVLGFFHLLYIWMISDFLTKEGYSLSYFQDNSIFILSSILLFFVTHLYSYKYNKEKDSKQKPKIGSMFIRPIFRILPIHFVPIIGAGATYAITTISYKISLVAFLSLKTLVDVIMHQLEHK